MIEGKTRMNHKRAKDPLRAFIRELLKIPGVKEVFYRHFKIPLRLKRSFDNWLTKIND
jgi:hypothetical protein